MAQTKFPPGMTVSLSVPGMSRFHRAGVGGLAASLHAIAVTQDPGVQWKEGVAVALGPGKAVVYKQKIDIDFGGDAKSTLETLSGLSFCVKDGLVYLPGAMRGAPKDVLISLHRAYTGTFLQHNKAKKKVKKGEARVVKDPNNEEKILVQFDEIRPLEGYSHQEMPRDVIEALEGGHVGLSGILLPGASNPWLADGARTQTYTPELALAAYFVLVGVPAWYNGVGTKAFAGGALLVPSPTDLLKFGKLRHTLTPSTYRDCINGGFGSCALSTHLKVLNDWRDAFGPATVIEFGSVAWDPQQVRPLSVTEVTIAPDDAFVAIAGVADLLPRDTDLFSFASNNVARGRLWWDGLVSHSLQTKKGQVFLVDQLAAGDDFGYKMCETLYHLKGTMTPDQQTTIDALRRTWRGATAQLHEAGGWSKVDNKRAEVGRKVRQTHSLEALLLYVADFVLYYEGSITPDEQAAMSSLTLKSLQTCIIFALILRQPKKES